MSLLPRSVFCLLWWCTVGAVLFPSAIQFEAPATSEPSPTTIHTDTTTTTTTTHTTDREESSLYFPYLDRPARLSPSSEARCSGGPVEGLKRGALTEVTVELKNGESRVFAVYVPESYNLASQPRVWGDEEEEESSSSYSPVALQLLFHGLNDNRDNFIKATGFIPYAEKHGYIIVTASGTLGVLGVAWNAGTCCGFFSDEKPDEVLFSQTIIEVLTTRLNLCIHEEKIFAVGFSNGAMLSEVLGCHLPYRIRAAASVGGVVELRPGNEGGLKKCDELVLKADKEVEGRPRRTSVLLVRGDADPMVPWEGSSWLGFPSVEDDFEGWRKRNGCQGPVENTINTSYYENYLYSHCEVEKADAEEVEKGWGGRSLLELVRVKGGAHGWPEDNGFSTTEHIIDFVQRVFTNFLGEGF